MRFEFVLSEIKIGLRRNLPITISVILVTAVSLALVGGGMLTQRQVETMKDYWFDRLQVSIFLCTKDSDVPTCSDGAVTQAQRDQILGDLHSPQLQPYVESVTYESQQQAYDRFRRQIKDNVLSSNVTVDQMPESYQVKLKDPKKYTAVTQLFQGRQGVEQVADQNQVLDRLFTLLNGAKWFAWGIALFILVASVLLVGVTIRMSAYTRRRETAIMRLVGASNFVIQLPFILESMISAAIGALLGSAILLSLTWFGVLGWLKGTVRFINYVQFSDALIICPILFLIAFTLAGVSSFVALRRYLKV